MSTIPSTTHIAAHVILMLRNFFFHFHIQYTNLLTVSVSSGFYVPYTLISMRYTVFLSQRVSRVIFQ